MTVHRLNVKPKEHPNGAFQRAVEDLMLLEGPTMTKFAIVAWYDNGGIASSMSPGALDDLDQFVTDKHLAEHHIKQDYWRPPTD